jgi:hypothetical protein
MVLRVFFADKILSPIFAARTLKLVLANDGAVAQSVEQRTENPCVGGSIPPHTTENKKVL